MSRGEEDKGRKVGGTVGQQAAINLKKIHLKICAFENTFENSFDNRFGNSFDNRFEEQVEEKFV